MLGINSKFCLIFNSGIPSYKSALEALESVLSKKGLKYVTKGDNNLTKDTEEISYEQILGTIVLKIPRIGNIILLLEDKIYIILLLNLIFYRYFFEYLL